MSEEGFRPKLRIFMWQKLLAILLFAIIAVVLSLGYIARNSLKNGVDRQLRTLHSEIVSVIAQEVNSMIENSNKMLVETTNIPGVRKFDVPTIETILNSLLSNFRIFTRVTMVNREGRVIYSTLKGDMKKNGKIWYSTIVKGNYDSRYISDLNFISGNLPSVTMAIPVRDKSHLVVGIIIAELDLSIFRDIVRRINIGPESSISIVNKNGVYIASSDENVNSGRPMEEFNELFRDGVKKFSGEYRDFVVSAAPLTYFKPKPDLGRFTPPNWSVILKQKKSVAYAESLKLNNEIFYFTILAIIIAIPISIFLSLQFTRHIKSLREEAERLSKGELDTPVIPKSYDEIGELAFAFEQMRKNLKKKIWELNTLFVVGQKISSVLNITDLLKLILSKNIEIMGADKGSLMLFDEETGRLRIEVQEGHTKEISQTQTDINSGVAGKVFRTGKPILIKDALQNEELKELKKGEEIYPGTLLSVPLSVKDRLLGVLNVSKNEPNSFDEDDLELFTALSVQGAIAIDNAILYKMAITDGMTKLYLHRYFQQRLDQEIVRSRRYDYKFSLIMMDIDHFKSFNDNYGHQNGDRVLKTVAKLVMSNVREVDIAARYGGEEFAVICPEIPVDEAGIPAERIRIAVESYKFYIKDELVPITISLGVSGWPCHASEKLELIDKADKALYASKEGGRNRVTIYSKELEKDG
jgi:diguanylate cyclase (GGDEF)-like protein